MSHFPESSSARKARVSSGVGSRPIMPRYTRRWTVASVARALGAPQACRAVGNALNRNPYAPQVPCHRVVGSQGAMGGFMNAVDGDPIAIKRWLLTHEGYRFGR